MEKDRNCNAIYRLGQKKVKLVMDPESSKNIDAERCTLPPSDAGRKGAKGVRAFWRNAMREIGEIVKERDKQL